MYFFVGGLTRDVPRLVDIDVEAILPLPSDGGLGAAARRALKGHVGTLGADLVPRTQAVFDPRGDCKGRRKRGLKRSTEKVWKSF